MNFEWLDMYEIIQMFYLTFQKVESNYIINLLKFIHNWYSWKMSS